MSDNLKIYAIRRAILQELKNVAAFGRISAAPMDVDTLIEQKSNTTLMYTPPEIIREQWNELKAFGYIEAIPGYGGIFCTVSQKGREQLSIEFPQDYFIHGPGALK